MINKLLPHAAHLLVALKKTIPAVLLLGSLSLVSAPTARAQIQFSVDAFTTDLLTITLLPSPLFTDGTSSVSSTLGITASASADWFLSLPSASGGGAWRDTAFSGITVLHAFNFIQLAWAADLGGVNASGLTSAMTFSFVGTGAFQPSVVDALHLTWDGGGGVLQSSVSAPFAGVAVPEPSSYALLGGLAMLGLAGTRRRRTAKASA
jgi:hypothetical protein